MLTGAERCILGLLERPTSEVLSDPPNSDSSELREGTDSIRRVDSAEDESPALPSNMGRSRRGSMSNRMGGRQSFIRGQIGGDALAAVQAKAVRTKHGKLLGQDSRDSGRSGSVMGSVRTSGGQPLSGGVSADDLTATDASADSCSHRCSALVLPILGSLSLADEASKKAIFPFPPIKKVDSGTAVDNRSAIPTFMFEQFSLKTRRFAEERDASRARQTFLKSLGVGHRRGLRLPLGKEKARIAMKNVGVSSPRRPSYSAVGGRSTNLRHRSGFS